MMNERADVCADAVFIAEKNVSVQTDYAVDSALGFNDDRKGVLLSTAASGAEVDLAGEFCGTFEMDFRVVSDDAFVHGVDISGNEIKNSALDLSQFKLCFTETESGKVFEVILDGGCNMNYATPQASVAFDGQRRGIFIYDHVVEGIRGFYTNSANTTQANSDGRYTALYGTSFSNTAYVNDDTLSETVSSTLIGFDPYTMQVYYKDGLGKKTLIWDMLDDEIDGQIATTLASFEKYSVSLVFSEVAINRTADLVVYSINGQTLEGESFENNLGPNAFASYSSNAVAGNKVMVKMPVTGDVLGDETISISVRAELNQTPITIFDKQGNKTDVYSDGSYVIPDKAGELKIIYTARDAEYQGVPFVASMEVFPVEPQINYTVSGSLESGEYGVGQEITLYEASVSSELFRISPQPVVSVYKDGVVLTEYNKIQPGRKITFTEAGNYKIVYSCENVKQKLSYKMTVTENAAAFNFNGELPVSGIEGETLEFPTATVSYQGETKAAEILVKYPNGGVYNDFVVDLHQAGLYEATYRAQFGDVEIEKTREVLVSGKQATFYNAAGSVTLGARNNRYAKMTGAYLYTTSSSSRFTYSQILNLSGATSADTLIKIYGAGPWGVRNGMPDIFLTDVHDPTNIITINLNYGYHEVYNYGFAYAPNQLEKSINGGTVWRPKDYWGTNFSYNVDEYISPIDNFENKQFVDLRYDDETKCLYQGKALFVDLDADYQEVPWKGFTTGEVYLSVGGVSHAMVTEVFGNDLSVGAYYTDTLAPTIFVDTQGWSEDNLPKATVGVDYDVFPANMFDNWAAEIESDIRVYYNYGTENCTEIMLRNGRFVPKKAGRYAIEYTAKDNFHNVAVKTVFVDAIPASDVEPIVFELETEPKGTGFLGAKYVLPTVVNATGGSSDLDGYTIEITDPNGNIRVGEQFFVPTMLGAYSIKYIVSDYSNNVAMKVYGVEVTANPNPILEEISVPDVILSGMTLKIPECNAVDYSTSIAGEKIATQVSVTLDGQPLSVSNGTVIPTISEKQGEVKIVYTAKGASETYTVKVINPGNEEGFMAEYFYVEEGDFTKEATKDGILFNSSTSNSRLQFINPVLASDFMIKFTIPDVAKTALDKLTIWLYDSENSNVYVKLDILKRSGDMDNSYLSINGGGYRLVSGSFFSSNRPIGFMYKQDSFTLMNLDGNVVGSLDSDIQNFKGFPSGKVFVKIGVGEVIGDVSLLLTQLNNQTFNASKSDSIVPEAALSENIPLLLMGTTLTIPALIAQDVLAPQVTVQVTVAKVGGKTLYTGKNNETVVLTIAEAGRYRINYTVSDGGRVPARLNYIVNTTEDEPPMMNFKTEMKTEYEVGDKLQLPEIEITDNQTKEPTLVVYWYDTDGAMWCLEKPEELIFRKAGKYQIKFFVYDDVYNYVEKSFTITVR